MWSIALCQVGKVLHWRFNHKCLLGFEFYLWKYIKMTNPDYDSDLFSTPHHKACVHPPSVLALPWVPLSLFGPFPQVPSKCPSGGCVFHLEPSLGLPWFWCPKFALGKVHKEHWAPFASMIEDSPLKGLSFPPQTTFLNALDWKLWGFAQDISNSDQGRLCGEVKVGSRGLGWVLASPSRPYLG